MPSLTSTGLLLEEAFEFVTRPSVGDLSPQKAPTLFFLVE